MAIKTWSTYVWRVTCVSLKWLLCNLLPVPDGSEPFSTCLYIYYAWIFCTTIRHQESCQLFFTTFGEPQRTQRERLSPNSPRNWCFCADSPGRFASITEAVNLEAKWKIAYNLQLHIKEGSSIFYTQESYNWKHIIILYIHILHPGSDPPIYVP